MNYLLLKQLHITCVVLSGAGFLLRGLWMLIDSPWRQRPLARVLPHCVDTVLLASALAMTVISAQYPFAVDWLTAKLIALVLYIGCGMMALKRARSRGQRAGYFAAALLVYAYIVSVAMAHSPLGVLASTASPAVAQPRW